MVYYGCAPPFWCAAERRRTAQKKYANDRKGSKTKTKTKTKKWGDELDESAVKIQNMQRSKMARRRVENEKAARTIQALNDTGDQWQSSGTAGVSLAKMKTVTKTEHMDPKPRTSAAICAHCVWASNLQELRITMPK